MAFFSIIVIYIVICLKEIEIIVSEYANKACLLINQLTIGALQLFDARTSDSELTEISSSYISGFKEMCAGR